MQLGRKPTSFVEWAFGWPSFIFQGEPTFFSFDSWRESGDFWRGECPGVCCNCYRHVLSTHAQSRIVQLWINYHLCCHKHFHFHLHITHMIMKWWIWSGRKLKHYSLTILCSVHWGRKFTQWANYCGGGGPMADCYPFLSLLFCFLSPTDFLCGRVHLICI